VIITLFCLEMNVCIHKCLFEEKTMRIVIYPIHFTGEKTPNKHLMVAKVGPHQVVVGNHYYEGQLGFFLPVGSIVPDKLAEEMWVLGRLGGNHKNRIVAKLMDGVKSDGLFYGSQGASWNPSWVVGQDITDELSIVNQYDWPVPTPPKE
jgi:hypothetical protein